MLLREVHHRLSWPAPEDIFSPSGAGPAMFANLARQKLGAALARRADASGVRVGVLSANPSDDATEAPIAVICEFPRAVSHSTLEEAQRLAWNFARTPLLITVEPHILRTWTCYARPKVNHRGKAGAEILEGKIVLGPQLPILEQAAHSLHWVELVSGEFFRAHATRFRRNERADRTLLQNLKFVRKQLHQADLDYRVIHDLIGRIIFIQFLFHRVDSNGVPALNASVLRRLYERKVLTREYHQLHEILRNHHDIYQLFRWLNTIFNGDLFPGKGATVDEREAEWQAEITKVQQTHLTLLADFIEGKLELERGQISCWPLYYFDVIPLEFISSIYEEFVQAGDSTTGAHYTRGHLVDFILDGVLPWDSPEWDLKVLDPACGSGIFLVKAFQRLIHRWRLAHPEQELRASHLRDLLSQNLFGIDSNEHAIRVASFSLYLAMCDEIDPKQYWTQVSFPRLRDHTLITADFFDPTVHRFVDRNAPRGFDLVVGNAPWGRGSAAGNENLALWARNNDWPLSNEDIGTAFLPRAAEFTEPAGTIVMLQSAGLLFNRGPNAQRIRERLFASYRVDEIVNFAALRAILFENAVSPACSVLLRPTQPVADSIAYVSPKPTETVEDQLRFQIDAYDVHQISVAEATGDPLVWTALMWGGRRDLALVRRLFGYDTLNKLRNSGDAIIREGIIRGALEYDAILGWPILEAEEFPLGTFLELDRAQMPVNLNPRVHRRTALAAFELPQLLIKQGWRKDVRRFEAVVTRGLDGQDARGILASQSYISVSGRNDADHRLEAACLSLNSRLAVYYLFLTSGRMAFYRTEALVSEILDVPIPIAVAQPLNGVKGLAELDSLVENCFELTPAERVLVEDMLDYTLADYKHKDVLPGWRRTRRTIEGQNEPDLYAYCNYLLCVLDAGFGHEGNSFCATIFSPPDGVFLPVRMVAIHFTASVPASRINTELLDSTVVFNRLQKLAELMQSASAGEGYQRVARLYQHMNAGGETVPTVVMVKPDRVRYWTRSVAIRDADEIAVDVMSWSASTMEAHR